MQFDFVLILYVHRKGSVRIDIKPLAVFIAERVDDFPFFFTLGIFVLFIVSGIIIFETLFSEKENIEAEFFYYYTVT